MRLVFAGTPQFAERALAALIGAGHDLPLVLTRPDSPAGRGMKLSTSPVKQVALSHGLEVMQPATLRDPAVAARLRVVAPDALVVAAYGLILPQVVLDVARFGALNIHASLLPRWRGAAPIQRAILAGDRLTGITIMQMDAGLDTGPTLAQRGVEIGDDDNAGSLHDKLALLGAELLLSVLGEIERGAASSKPQPAEGIIYADKISKAEARLDWRKPASELNRAVRAFNPFPGAQASLSGVSMKIWGVHCRDSHGQPGSVLAADAAGIVVACGQGALVLTVLQRGGARRMNAGEFLRGHPIEPGSRFALPD